MITDGPTYLLIELRGRISKVGRLFLIGMGDDKQYAIMTSEEKNMNEERKRKGPEIWEQTEEVE